MFETPSILKQRWELRPVDERLALALAQRHGWAEWLCRLLVARGVAPDECEAYLNPTLREQLPDPSHLKDMDKAAQRLADAIEAGEAIAVFGDYDVDGATSSSLLIRYLRQLGIEPILYIPDRMLEGYGPNPEAMRELARRGAKLVVTVDTGITAHAALQVAQDEGLEVLVVDHHQGTPDLPPAVAVVNPNRFDEDSPHGYMAAVGVTFLLLVAVNRVRRERGLSQPNLLDLLDIVALGTVADVVPLRGANRAFVRQGLKQMATRRNAGLAALADAAGMDEPPAAYHLGFLLGPRINAAGRLSDASIGVKLLTSDDPEECRAIAETLNRLNAERQAIEAEVLEAAMKQAELQDNCAFICVAAQGWHEGVIGIVAGRLKERFGRPVAVVALLGDGRGKGSARSIEGVDLGQAIIAARQEGLLVAGGGHAMAAGFTVDGGKLDDFIAYLRNRLDGDVAQALAAKRLLLDAMMPLSAATPALHAMIEQAGPWGSGNPTPRLVLQDLKVIEVECLKGAHVKLLLRDGTETRGCTARIKAMAFRCADTPLGLALLNARGRRMHLAGQLKLNRWNGRESAEFIIDDAMLID